MGAVTIFKEKDQSCSVWGTVILAPAQSYLIASYVKKRQGF